MSKHPEMRSSPLILVVDDSKLIQLKLRDVLERDGYSVTEAGDGVQALDAYERLRPDIVLMDAIMPVMDGFTACARLQKLPGGDRTPVLMVTSLDDDKSVNLAFEAGATDFITKPIHWAVLRHRVHRLLRARKAEEILKKRLAYEKMVSDISFLSLQIEDKSLFLKECLDIMGKNVDVSRIFIYEYDPEAETAGNIFEWLAPGIIPRKDSLQDIPLNYVSWWINKIKDERLINCQDIEDISDERGKEILRSLGVKSMLGVSLDIENHPCYIGLDECRFNRSWPDEDIDVLRVIAQMIGGALGRKQVENSLRKANVQIEQLLASISSVFIGVNWDNRIIQWNAAAERTFGIPAVIAEGKPFYECGICWDWNIIVKNIEEAKEKITAKRLDDLRYTRPDGKEGLLGITLNPVAGEDNKPPGYVLLGTDITELKKIEAQLVFSQKMESIGQLAAGIAHEINTPMQYIGDNMVFLKNSFSQICEFFKLVNDLIEAADKGPVPPGLIETLKDIHIKLDINYLEGEIPEAIEQTQKGIRRVTELVLAMKEFSHPGAKEKMFSDINSAIEGTITISKNEWKYVADLETDLDRNLPRVYCVINELNQVILNMIVNAAQAIKEVLQPESLDKGKISITTRKRGEYVQIFISDTGNGIPESIIHKIYDPFFTTKDVGKGTGQGLSIAHDIIVNKHGGSINVESEMGKGTTFTLILPIKPKNINGE